MIVALIFIFGVIIGSFLNVVIYRVPKGESTVFPSSKCQHCQSPLKWWHNIPILSWLFLSGKCYFCKEKISAQYPIIELLAGLIVVTIYFKLGLVWYLPLVVASFLALLALVMIDFKYMAVPDSINFAALAFALVQPEFLNAILYSILAAGGLYLVGWISSLIARRQAMGGADVIVKARVRKAAWSSSRASALFLSALLAIIPALLNRKTGVPFVPFLALATFIVYIYDNQTAQLLEGIIYG